MTLGVIHTLRDGEGGDPRTEGIVIGEVKIRCLALEVKKSV